MHKHVGMNLYKAFKKSICVIEHQCTSLCHVHLADMDLANVTRVATVHKHFLQLGKKYLFLILINISISSSKNSAAALLS